MPGHLCDPPRLRWNSRFTHSSNRRTTTYSRDDGKTTPTPAGGGGSGGAGGAGSPPPRNSTTPSPICLPSDFEAFLKDDFGVRPKIIKFDDAVLQAGAEDVAQLKRSKVTGWLAKVSMLASDGLFVSSATESANSEAAQAQ